MSVMGKYTFSDFRKENPEYDDVPADDLANALYNEHFSDVPRREFDLRMGLKEGQYNTTDEIANSLVGYGDEITAGGKSLVNKGMDLVTGQDSPESSLDYQLENERAEQAYYREENPIKSTLATLGGGLALGGGGYQQVAKKVGPYIGSVLTGAAMGGLYGSGEGEGLEGKVQGGLTGMGIGALMGAGIPAIGMFGGKVLNHVKDASPWQNVPAASIRRIITAMENDGLTPQQAATRMQEMANSGRVGMLADQGENLTKLGAYVGKQPGAGRRTAMEKLTERQIGTVDRITEAIQKDVARETNIYGVADDLHKARSKLSAPAYKTAYEKNFISSDLLDEIMTRPAIKKAMREAQIIAANEGRDPMALGYTFNEAGDVVYHASPSMETHDLIKRGLDAVIEPHRVNGVINYKNPKVKGLVDLRTKYRKELVDKNPAYGVALRIYSGPSQSIEAMEMGFKYAKSSPEEITKKLNKMSPNDKEFYRIGVARAIKNTAESRGETTNIGKTLIGSRKKQNALRPIFRTKADFDRFEKALRDESRMHRTFAKTTEGSITAEMMEEGRAFGVNAINFGRSASRGDVLGSVGAVGKGILERYRGNNSKTSEEIGNILFQSNPETLKKYIAAISKQSTTNKLLKRTPTKTGLFAQPFAAYGAGQTGNRN